MIALDTNILVWAHRSDVNWYTAAFATIAELVRSGQRWAMP